jgi:hypothetical protein
VRKSINHLSFLFLLVESSSRGFGVHFQRARSVLELQAPDEGEGQKTVLLLSLSEEEADASVVGPHFRCVHSEVNTSKLRA